MPRLNTQPKLVRYDITLHVELGITTHNLAAPTFQMNGDTKEIGNTAVGPKDIGAMIGPRIMIGTDGGRMKFRNKMSHNGLGRKPN